MSLLQTVLDDPADVRARLVYGDALLAAGDPRGELIAVEHQWAQHRSIELALRRTELRREHGAAWWPEIATRFVRTRCGFVEAIALPATEIEKAERLFSTEPIEEVELIGAVEPAHFEILWPASIARLVARSINAQGLIALASSALGAQLETLDISGASGWIDAVPAGALPRCTRLNAARSGLIVERLLTWDRFDGLRELDLSCGEVDEAELHQFIERAPPALRVLKFSRNDFGDAGAFALAEGLSRFPALRRLELVGCEISESGAERLRAACPAGLAIALSSGELGPAPIIDLVGTELRFSRAEDGAWTIASDDVPRRITVRELETFSIGGPWLRSETTGDTGRLDHLVEAIAMGAPRTLAADGKTSISLWPLRYDPSAAIINADLRVPESDAPIEIDVETYID